MDCKQKWKKIILFLSVFLLYIMYFPMEAKAETMTQSPYVSFSPDGSAWTVREEVPYTDHYFTYWESEEYPEYWYPDGTTYNTGIVSNLRGLRVGEHYYAWKRYGEVPVGRWTVVHQTGKCIHETGEGVFNGYTNIIEPCFNAYYSGWFAYCADCGGVIKPTLMYMSKDAAQTIKSINTYYAYYYVCPSNGHVENASAADAHTCKEISYNMYEVRYLSNDNGAGVSGQMMPSYHMYNNANIYEGREVTPQTSLTLNSFKRTGYVFVGWNTKPDGSGTFYEDGAEILNLSVYDYRQDKEVGTVKLYAQWEKAKSTLYIDPNGGSYDGNSGITSLTKPYLTMYTMDESKLTPPKGYTVSFEANGGTAVGGGKVQPVTGTNKLNSWMMSYPFNGRFRDNIYAFLGEDDVEDTLTASYDPQPIILPSVEKKGWSFGGWYYDGEFTQPAGGAGDTIVPDKDMTLYAQWVDLELKSKDNYTVNDGKGAVDLTWSQSDNNNKSYIVYQSTDSKNWTKVNSATDISNERVIGIPFQYSGKSVNYTVPYTGIYTLEAFGAQGANYGTKTGGLGGGVVAKVWLTKGEILTLNIGGTNGYNGGGKATMYGNGGGSSTIVSNLRGTLLVGGGGGGATSIANGGSGGLRESLRADEKPEGADGGAGGGAGFVGGNAGEAIVHTCTDACYTTINTDILSAYSGYYNTYGWTYEKDDGGDQKVQELRFGSPRNYIPINGSTSLHLQVLQNLQRSNAVHTNDPEDSYIAVYDQNERLIYQRYGYERYSDYFVVTDHNGYFDDDDEWITTEYESKWGHVGNYTSPLFRVITELDKKTIKYSSGNFTEFHTAHDAGTITAAARAFKGTTMHREGTAWYGGMGTYFYEDIPIPSGTTGIRIVSSVEYNVIYQHDYKAARLTGGKIKTCGYEDGQIISYLPAYGGSDYVNSAYSNSYTFYAGNWQGNGAINVGSVKIGFVDSLELSGVLAPDKAAPQKVSEETALIEAVDGADGQVRVTWDVPKDNGTDYYHKVESYLIGSENPLCTSNITKNTLTSGIAGYYYRVDYSSTGNVTKGDDYIKSPNAGASVSFNPQGNVAYVHVAAVDVAGNLGATTHIKVEDIAWNLSTEKITITDIIGGTDYGTVHAKGDGSYYVRADGEGPFQLAFNSKMHGVARADYQINYQIFASKVVSTSEEQRYITKLPYSDPLTSTGAISASRFVRKVEGSGILADAMNTGASRYNTARNNTFYQSFNIPSTLHGQSIVITPVAGATYRQDVKYSVWEKDKLNSITLIADGEAPLVSGAEILEGLTEIDRDEQDVHLDLTAMDALSGVKEFRVTIINNDSLETKEYLPDADGHIKINLTGSGTIYLGDLSIEVTAIDSVGNQCVKKYRLTEFAIEAWVERILPPHEPVFQRGESGILHITTWGYVDRVEVEFPREMLEQNPELNTVYDYKNFPSYIHEESSQFMIPLYIPVSDTYTITVRAYKEGKQIDAYPDISIVEIGGTVLDEFRTRLR